MGSRHCRPVNEPGVYTHWLTGDPAHTHLPHCLHQAFVYATPLQRHQLVLVFSLHLCFSNQIGPTHTSLRLKSMSTPAIQNAILVRLAEDGRRFRWPVLTPRAWEKIENDPTYADRTEFIGDSLIHTTIALRLHERFPYATAGAYTVCFDHFNPSHSSTPSQVMIQALVSNATFYHLSAVAPTTYYVSRTCPWTGKDTRHILATKVPYATSKRGGDKFETVLAEYHALYGFGALLDWTRRNFDNLIDVAWDALQESSVTPSVVVEHHTNIIVQETRIKTTSTGSQKKVTKGGPPR
jgi:hypothetical protein